MRTVDALRDLEELGSTQWGLITAGQAARLGINRVTLGRLSDKGALTRIRHGVYSLPSADFGPLQDLRAAWLAVDSKHVSEERFANPDDAVASHTSAAAVHGLGDVVATHHEFTAPVRRQSTQPDLRFHKAPVANDKVLIEGLPVTSLARTVADLATAQTDFDHLATIVRDALDKTELSASELDQKLTPHAGRYGYDSGTALIEACVKKAGLPHATSQMLKHYPNALNSVLASQLESMMEPLMESMLHKHFLPEITQQTALRSLLAGRAFENLKLTSDFTTATGLNLISEQLNRNSNLASAAVIKALKVIEDEQQRRDGDGDGEDDDTLPRDNDV